MGDARRISLMGSTGSIGRSAVSVIEHANRAGDPVFKVVAMAAGRDAAALAEQALRLKPEIAVVADEAALPELRARLAGTGIETAGGLFACIEAASRPADRLLAAIVGIAGLPSTLAAVKVGTDVAIANKESIVCAGRLILMEAALSGARILPVDSEHSAIFQCLGDGRGLEKLTITASGGPFRTASLADMARATPQQAAAHPNWSMGIKNSIDSATLMNKALELIEAAFLFNVPNAQIDVLVHPQSIIHGMAHFTDGSVIAQLSAPDMKAPIAYALGWPERIETTVARLDLAKLGQLDFSPVDGSRFPAVGLARAALDCGNAATTVLNCANETAVSAFIAGHCGFLDISSAVQTVLDRFLKGNMAKLPCDSLEEIAYLDRVGRELAQDALGLARARAGG